MLLAMGMAWVPRQYFLAQQELFDFYALCQWPKGTFRSHDRSSDSVDNSEPSALLRLRRQVLRFSIQLWAHENYKKPTMKGRDVR